jgi:uncharacterized protein (TIGR03089 family)
MDVGLAIVANLSIANALAGILARDGARPLITQVWADGQRSELSVRTFENNVAKAANLLQDDADAGPGSSILLQLPLHWQHSVWLTAGALVGTLVHSTLDIEQKTDTQPMAAFVDEPRAHQQFPFATYVVSLHPLGLPSGEIPSGTIDLAREVRGFSDVFTAYESVEAGTPWLQREDEVLAQGEAVERAIELARSLGLEPGGRLLVSGTVTPATILGLAAVPLALNASVVICAVDADIDDISRTERCTAALISG